MLNLLNVWLLVGMTNFINPSLPVTPPSDSKQITITRTIDKPTTVDCTSDDIKAQLASFFYVSPDIIELSSDMNTFSLYHPKGIEIDGALFYVDCGTDCTTVIIKTYIGIHGSFTLNCDLP